MCLAFLYPPLNRLCHLAGSVISFVRELKKISKALYLFSGMGKISKFLNTLPIHSLCICLLSSVSHYISNQGMPKKAPRAGPSLRTMKMWGTSPEGLSVAGAQGLQLDIRVHG